MPAIIRIGDPVDCGDFMGQGSDNVLANNIPASRQDVDHTIGHCYAPAHVFAASPNVFTNNHAQDRVGDPIYEPEHVCPGSGSHPGKMAAGSPDVYVNNYGGAPSIDMDDLTAEFYASTTIFEMSPYIQPTALLYDAMTHETDDEGAEAYEYNPTTGQIVTDTQGKPKTDGTVPFTEKQQGVAASAVKENVDIKTPETLSAPASIATTTPNAPSSTGEGDIDGATSFPGSFQLSPNYTLSDLTTNTMVSNYTLKAQHGLSEKDIVKNLRKLCYNILEPLRAMYPGIRVNSGFRHSSTNGKSQHERGQAADMSLSSASSNSTAWPVAQAIANSSLPYDQFIYEQNRTIWFHLSYNPSGTERRMVLTKSRSQDKPTIGLRQVL